MQVLQKSKLVSYLVNSRSMNCTHRFKAGVRACLSHFIASLIVVTLCAVWVLGVWFPFPYRELVGGRELFLIVAAVDVVCGPLLTLVLYDPAKSKREVITDLALVVVIQLGALAYGLWTVTQVRPLYAVFEVDRIRVVTVADIDPADWATAQPPWNRPHWEAPQLISVREARNAEEQFRSIDLAMQGKDIALRPDWWKSLDDNDRQKILWRSKPIVEFERKLNQDHKKVLNAAVQQAKRSPSQLRFLPMTSTRGSEWIVLLDAANGKPLAYAPLDGF
jgi:hypothetical protein